MEAVCPWNPQRHPSRRRIPSSSTIRRSRRCSQRSATFPPPAAFVAQANAQAEPLRRGRDRDFEAFWAKLARERISWYKPFDTTLEWDLPFAKWFVGGKLNVAYNCVDRHVENGLGSKVAYHWIGEPGDTRTITYADLQREVSKTANALLELGITTGDRVAIYMPMIPELPIAMLACARIGAPHTVVFGGFSAEALAGRIDDAQAKLVITADGGWRRGKPAPLKPAVDEAVLSDADDRARARRRAALGDAVDGTAMTDGRDVWWHEIVDRQSDRLPAGARRQRAHALPAVHVGHHGQAEGHPPHDRRATCSARSYSHWAIFDIKPDDVYWCAADIGWVTGHSYIVYGPLANATTGVMYEGTPDTPSWERWWQIIEEYKVNVLYCAPTAIRAFMKQGDAAPREARPVVAARAGLASASRSTRRRGSGTTSTSAAGRRPIVDTWWQTETGQILITPLPGVTTTKPGRATFPFPGIEADVVDARGQVRAARRRRLSRPEAAVAGDAARHLRRPGALQGRRTGAASRACTSRATAPSATRRATSGSSAASTT